MGVYLKVTIRDHGTKGFYTQEITSLQKISENDTKNLAKECEKVIQETILRKSEMPTGKLASSIIAEEITNGWGVGDIAYLDATVKYWNHVDKGSEGIGANWSHYLPKGFWINGRWVESPNGFSGIKPMTPIPAMNYIASTLAQMEVLTPLILSRKI
jgi:hypothetical protein